MDNRYIRQQDIVSNELLNSHTMAVIGVGAVGRQLAIQLATIGVKRLILVDPQNVEVENLGAQGYFEADLGQPKVEATANVLRQINKDIQLALHAKPFKADQLRSLEPKAAVIFACVDTMTARKQIWQACRTAKLYIDSRMSTETLRILTVSAQDIDSQDHYCRTLFGDEEMFREPCTAKTTFYCASIQAGLCVSQLTKWLRNMPLQPDQRLNLLSGEWIFGQ